MSITFDVVLVAKAYVSSTVSFVADTLEEAKELAIKEAKEGGAIWGYVDVIDSTIEAGE